MTDIIIEMKNTTERNSAIDILRLVVSSLVVFAHCKFPGLLGMYVRVVARCAVPVFLIISGYYLYDDNPQIVLDILIRRVKKSLLVLSYALLFYFIWELLLRLVGSGIDSVLSWIRYDLLTWRTLINTLLFDVDPLAGHLWYLFSLVRSYCLLFLYLKVRNISNKTLGIPIFLFAALFYLERTKVSYGYYRNGWFFGISFLIIGYLIALNKEWLCRYLTIKILSVIGCVSVIFSFVEYRIIGDAQLFVGAIILAIVLLLICIIVPAKGSFADWLSVLGRNYSALVYVVHWAIIEVFVKIDKMVSVSENDLLHWFQPLLVLLLSYTVSCQLFKVIKKMNNRIVK